MCALNITQTADGIQNSYGVKAEDTRVYPKVSGLSHNETYQHKKHSLRSNTKGYDGKPH
jgi:hypothetical protein